uniref:Ionotropic receptor 75p n=1 Tax=Conogethes pinicolalis TaxID=1178461 RepID=A0A5B9GDF2_9NEOP|nr:ionotropic receptor 75p [Conogethes pinicolalis]
MKAYVIFLIIFIKYVLARDNFTINFINSFIENEGKPTIVISTGLCWGKHIELKMVKLFSYLGVRSSSSIGGHSHIQDQHLLFLADMECPEVLDVLNNATSNNLFQFPFRWLILSREGSDVTNSTLWSCPLLTDSDLVLAAIKGNYVTMTELHKPSMNHSMQLTQRGFYNGSFYDTRPHRELYRRRKDLMGTTVIMSNVIQDSNDTKEHIEKEDRLDLHNDAVVKGCWMVAKHSYEMLNATRRHIYSYRWGYKVNGQWSGMIADIKSNKANTGTNCFITTDRLEEVAFTDMVMPVRLRFIFRQPPLPYIANIFSLPFSTDVWIAIVVCSVAATLALFFTSTWDVSMERNPTQLDGSISDALLLTLSAVAQQGCFIEPTRAPGRIIEWFFFAALMALYAAYSANIVVLLQAPSNSIRTLAQLAASKITLGAADVDVDYNRFVFSLYNDSVRMGIYRRVIPENGPPNFYSFDQGVEKIRQGLFAFHAIAEPVYHRIVETFKEAEKCDISQVDFVSGFDGFTPIKKDSPYLEVIRVTYKQIRESGIQSAVVRRFSVPPPHCVTSGSTFSSVGLLDVWPVIIFMLYGVAFSIFIFFAELLVHKLLIEARRFMCKRKDLRLRRRIKIVNLHRGKPGK